MAINFRSNTIIKNLSIGPTVGTPIVNLVSNQTEINESGTVVFSITTQNIEAGTLIPYSISGVTTTDISPSPLSGNFVVGTTETVSITAVNDEDTDGDKTMVMTLPSNGNLTASCIVRDTSQTPPPIVNLASNQTEINESGTVTFSITTENIEAGTLIPYSISGVTTTDISPSPLSGNFVVGTTETISITAVNDEDTDGDKTMVMTLPSNGNLTASCIVRDTSQTPPHYITVGAMGVNTAAGAAYIYNGTNLSATPTKLAPSGLSIRDKFGYSSATIGSQLVIGAPGTSGGSDTGAVYVYDTSNLSATPTILAPSELEGNDAFGWSVAANPNQLVIGAYRDVTAQGSDAGSVYVYDANNLSSTPTLLAPPGTAGSRFGHSVAATSNQIVVGALLDSDQGTYAGAAYVYDATNLSATPTKLTPSSLDSRDNFGSSVAASSNQIVVGAYNDDDQGANAGAVYVYDATNLAAAPTKLAPSGLDGNDIFGYSVAVTSNQIVVGARFDADQGTQAGAVYVYDATNLSATPTKLTPSALNASDDFGYSVAAYGNQIAVGARYDDDQGSNAGAVYVYDATNLSATPTLITAFDGASGNYFGSSVSLG